MLQFLKTGDGSFSLYSEKYGDFYHSTKDGAILETLYKHIIPAFGLLQLIDLSNPAKDLATNRNPQNPIKILDICFGLGYNALFSLAFAKKCGFAIKIHSVELHLLESLRDFAYPKILQSYLPLREILDSLYMCGAWECENLALYLHKGDAKIYLQNLADSADNGASQNRFDIIYQDAFSPSKNTELWSESHFKNLFALLKNNGTISTYSSNKKVREICQNLGFTIYNMQCGSLKNGTIIRKNPMQGDKTLQIECIRLEKL